MSPLCPQGPRGAGNQELCSRQGRLRLGALQRRTAGGQGRAGNNEFLCHAAEHAADGKRRGLQSCSTSADDKCIRFRERWLRSQPSG